MNELNRISSHLVWLATSALELGAVSVMLYGFREREILMDIFEDVTGLRMNHAYIRIGGVIMDLTETGVAATFRFLDEMPKRIDDYETILNENPIWLERNVGVGVLSAERALALGVTGPVLRAAGVAADLRKDMPYCGYETYEFDVVTRTEADAYARYVIRLDEMRESMKIARQCLERLEEPGPIMIEDPKIAWPAKLSVGPDGIGNDPAVPAPHHGGVDGGPDPSLQDGDPGRAGACRRGIPGRRIAPRRAGVLRRIRWRAPSHTA